jgi:hypothetical protein
MKKVQLITMMLFMMLTRISFGQTEKMFFGQNIEQYINQEVYHSETNDVFIIEVIEKDSTLSSNYIFRLVNEDTIIHYTYDVFSKISCNLYYKDNEYIDDVNYESEIFNLSKKIQILESNINKSGKFLTKSNNQLILMFTTSTLITSAMIYANQPAIAIGYVVPLSFGISSFVNKRKGLRTLNYAYLD